MSNHAGKDKLDILRTVFDLSAYASLHIEYKGDTSHRYRSRRLPIPYKTKALAAQDPTGSDLFTLTECLSK